MNVFYTKLALLSLAIVTSIFAFYGAKISEVKYYSRGISFFVIGFLIIALSIFISFFNYPEEFWINIIKIIGGIFVLAGVVVLTWFRKKLGL